MPKFGIEISAYVQVKFDKKPTRDEVIASLREDIDELLDNLDVGFIEEVY